MWASAIFLCALLGVAELAEPLLVPYSELLEEQPGSCSAGLDTAVPCHHWIYDKDLQKCSKLPRGRCAYVGEETQTGFTDKRECRLQCVQNEGTSVACHGEVLMYRCLRQYYDNDTDQCVVVPRNTVCIPGGFTSKDHMCQFLCLYDGDERAKIREELKKIAGELEKLAEEYKKLQEEGKKIQKELDQILKEAAKLALKAVELTAEYAKLLEKLKNATKPAEIEKILKKLKELGEKSEKLKEESEKLKKKTDQKVKERDEVVKKLLELKTKIENLMKRAKELMEKLKGN